MNSVLIHSCLAHIHRRCSISGQVFISYSSKDVKIAESLHQSLNDEGIPVWRDKESLEVGRPWSEFIQQAIETCTCLIVVCTPDCMASKIATQEWQYALELKKPVLPLILTECKPPSQLKTLHCLNFTTSNLFKDSFQKLLYRLQDFQFTLESPVVEISGGRFTWQAVSGASHYIVERSSDKDFLKAIDKRECRFNSYQIRAVDSLSREPTYYRFKSLGKSAVNNSDWSNTVEVGGNRAGDQLNKLLDELKKYTSD